jgi:putative ABC transport system ATP-binding protein
MNTIITAQNLVKNFTVGSNSMEMLKGKNLSLMKDIKTSILRRCNVGFVIQIDYLVANLNVEDKILLLTLLDDKMLKETCKLLDEIQDIVQLFDRSHHTPSEISGGQQQREAIARALINHLEIIIADEPAGNPDSHTGSEVLDLFKNSNEIKGKTIVMITHYKEITAYNQRMIHVKDGKIW